MQALRLARPRVALRTVNVVGARGIAATANQAHAASAPSTSSASVIPLSNVEAQWDRLSSEEQLAVHQQLEEVQKKDWKTLSLDEKKAGAYFPPQYPCFVESRVASHDISRSTRLSAFPLEFFPAVSGR